MEHPNDAYYDRFQLPIFLTLIALLWVVVGIRLWAFRKNYCGWKSWRGISMAMTVSSAIFCTFYVAMLIANYFLNERIIRIRDVLSSNPATQKIDRDPATYTEDEVNTIIKAAKLIYTVQLFLRIELSVALWLIKFAFIALFLETREALSNRWLVVLHSTTTVVFITFIIVIWTICKDIIQYWISPTAEDIRDGIYTNGIRFVALEPDNEFVLTVANIITDIVLVVIACKTVMALNRPISAASLLFVMVTITISVAVGRLILNILTMDLQFYSAHATIPRQLLAELETFCAAIVSCLPGLRVLLRSRQAEQETYIENTVIVPDHEMLDVRNSTRFPSSALDARFDTDIERPSSEDPSMKTSSSSSYNAIQRQISLA